MRWLYLSNILFLSVYFLCLYGFFLVPSSVVAFFTTTFFDILLSSVFSSPSHSTEPFMTCLPSFFGTQVNTTVLSDSGVNDEILIFCFEPSSASTSAWH